MNEPDAPEWVLRQIEALQREFVQAGSSRLLWRIHVWRWLLTSARPRTYLDVLESLRRLSEGRVSFPPGQQPIDPDPAGTASDLLRQHANDLGSLASRGNRPVT